MRVCEGVDSLKAEGRFLCGKLSYMRKLGERESCFCWEKERDRELPDIGQNVTGIYEPVQGQYRSQQAKIGLGRTILNRRI